MATPDLRTQPPGHRCHDIDSGTTHYSIIGSRVGGC
jgi:hypothetical protein